MCVRGTAGSGRRSGREGDREADPGAAKDGVEHGHRPHSLSSRSSGAPTNANGGHCTGRSGPGGWITAVTLVKTLIVQRGVADMVGDDDISG